MVDNLPNEIIPLIHTPSALSSSCRRRRRMTVHYCRGDTMLHEHRVLPAAYIELISTPLRRRVIQVI